jgi:ATP-binding cassette, subfamily B, bacterial PglK
MRESAQSFFIYIKEIFHLLGTDRSKIPIYILLFLSVAGLDLIGLGLIIPYVTLIVSPEVLGNTAFESILAKLGLRIDSNIPLILLSVILIVVFSLKTVGVLFIHWRIISFSKRQLVRLRSHLMDCYQRIPYNIYTQRNSSEYIFAIQSLSAQFSGRVILPAMRALSDLIMGTSILIMSIVIAPNIIFALGATLTATLFLYDRLIRTKVRSYGERSNAAATGMLQAVNEGIFGIKEIRTLGIESWFHEKFLLNVRSQAENEAKAEFVSVLPRYILEFFIVSFLAVLIIIVIIYYGSLLQLIPVLTFVVFSSLRLMPSFNTLMMSITALRSYRNSVSLLYRDVIELEAYKPTETWGSSNSRDSEDFRTVELRNVTYTYPASKRQALSQLSLCIDAGMSVGIIGTSGAGKTTLVDVLLGLIEPDEGEIIYNGRKIGRSLSCWRDKVAYIPQHIFLMDNTLRCNVAMGVDFDKIDEHRVRESLRLASLAPLVDGLPNGIDTMIGEGGIRLSGGQRQRVALARAFYHDRSLLVMDESTSALDQSTELEIIEEVRRLRGVKTLIVIAHRLTTVRHCDVIYRMEDGRIVEFGSYDQIT